MLKQVTPAAAIDCEQRKEGSVIVIMITPDHDKVKYVKLKDLLAGCLFLAEDQAPEADQKPEKEKPEPGSTTAKHRRSRKIDVGKIMALHNAGWSNIKIADEMNLHPITVGKYVKAEKEKQNG